MMIERSLEHGDRELSESSKPGAALRRAREAAKLTVQDVASQMNLDAHVITALEADDYAHLAGPTYTRGYIRNYARLVSLDPAPLVATFNYFAQEPPPLHPASSERIQQARSGDRPMVLATIAIIVTTVALAVTWWNTHRDPTLTSGSPPAETAQSDTTPEPELLAPATPAPLPANEATPAPAPLPAAPVASAPADAATLPAPASVSTPVAGESAPASEAAVQTPTLAAPTEASSSAPPAPSDSTAAAATADTTDDDLPQPNASAGTSKPADVAEPAPGAGRLELAVGATEAWIEIKDATGRRLYFGTARPNSTVSVEGSLPLSAVIGRVASVTATFAGKRLNLAPFASTGVARFTIDANGVPR